MNRQTVLALFLLLLFHFSLFPFTCPAAVPLRWTVETSRVQPAVFDVVHGETIELEAALQSYGKPLSMAGKTVSLFYQTNGMDTAWWKAPAQVKERTNPLSTSTSSLISQTTNILSATFTPSMDPGGATVNGFIGSTGDMYRAAFTLRFRKGPGARPNVIAQPPKILDLAHTVVINPPWPTKADFAATSTVMKAELKTYVDEEISGAGLVTPQAVTNAAGAVASNVVTKAYVEALGIESGLDTGAVATVVTNHVTSGYLCTVAAAQATYLPKTGGTVTGNLTIYGSEGDMNYGWEHIKTEWHNFGTVVTTTLPAYLSSLSWVYAGGGSPTHTISQYGITDAYTKTEVDTALSGKASASTVAQLNVQVAALGANANAEDARVIVTNCNSTTKMPEAKFEVKVSNSWMTVWNEMTRWNAFLGRYSAYTNSVNAALALKGEKEWGWFDSATGNPSPNGILQLAQPKIQICSGAAYQRYCSTAGTVWVLESNGLVCDINGTTNGFFRISDDEGNAQFEIVKGDKQSLFARASTMTQQQMGVTHYFTTYCITNAVTAPVAEFTRSLTNIVWIKQTEANKPCNVNWTNNGNNSWTVEWWPIGNEPELFMRAGYERGGETYIRNAVPVEMQYIYIGGTKYLIGTATISGHTVLTLTAQ